MTTETRTTDAKGRVCLPKAFANSTVIVEHVSDTEVRIRKAKVIPVDNILFASEMIGAVRGIDPETGFPYDDTKRYIEASM